MTSGGKAAGHEAAKLAEGLIAREAKSVLRRAARRGGKGAARAARKDARKAAQGFTERQWQRFSRGARRLRREAGLPEGDLVAHGSRVRGTAHNASDIDVALRVDDKTFFDLAEQKLARARPGTKLRKAMLDRINGNGQLSSFDLGTDFQRLRRSLLDSESPHKVQFSVLRKGGRLDTGPFTPLD